MSNAFFIISFEFFPPKTPDGQTKLNETAQQLANFAPNFFSVTYGAGGSTRDGTINTVKNLQKHTAAAIAPHLSCVGSTKKELIDVLHIYKSLGVTRIVALRGDLPSGMGHSGELKYANELVELIRESTGNHFHIEVAAYPEFHPQAKSATDDVRNLKIKIHAGADSAITQYFYNADAYFHFVDQCAKNGIFVPIIPGIMPITNFSKLIRFSESCGAEIPLWIRKRLIEYGDDQESIKAFGIEVVYDLCQRLIKGGAPGLHFYTLNHAEASSTLLNALKVTTLSSVSTSLLETIN